MSTDKKPKWELGATIQKGKQATNLADKYETELQPRLQADELPQFKANVNELESRQAGQSENLVTQKSKTLGQDELLDSLHGTVISIRNIVKSASPLPEVSKAYGVGERIYKTVSSMMSASNMILVAYQEYTAWSHQAGIIEADMTEITGLQEQLETADNIQETSKFTRKSATLDKNMLQRAVEDEITKLAALGMHVFGKTDPAAAQLFADLIPG